ncbi:MAG: hypothetical protein ACLP9L_41575 [Thermoguttaceae bacterium]
MTEHEQSCIRDLQTTIRDYHGDVKRRLDLAEDTIRQHDLAINGIPGDDTVPGLNVEVQSLRGFRERVRFGVSAAWAALLTLATVVWQKK